MYRILQGDVIEQVRTLADASVDAIVTDPPYGLKFMGKGWDAPWRTDRRQGFKEEIQMPDNPYGRSKVRNGSGRSYGADQRIMQALQGWHFSWRSAGVALITVWRARSKMPALKSATRSCGFMEAGSRSR